jgi:hypothetical protein
MESASGQRASVQAEFAHAVVQIATPGIDIFRAREAPLLP